MENVVDFPTKAVRDWAMIERAINENLSAIGVSPSAKERVTQRMKAFWDMLDPKIDLSFDIDTRLPVQDEAQLRAIGQSISDSIGKKSSTQLQAFTHALLIERIKHELEVCGELGLL